MTESKQGHKVASLQEVENRPQVATVNEKKFILAHVNGEVYAYRNVCPHQGGPVAEGRVDTDECTIICPWHGWEFDLEGGQNPFTTEVGKQLPQAKATVQNGDVYIID